MGQNGPRLKGPIMAKSLKDRILQVLVEQKLITEKALQRARKLQDDQGGSLGKILVQEGFIAEKDLIMILSKELNIPPINLSKYKVETEAVSLVPERIAKRYRLIPICKLGNTLVVSMADPLNIFALDELKLLTNYNIEPVLSLEADILQAIDKYYAPQREELSDLVKDEEVEELEVFKPATDELDISQSALLSQAQPIIKIVNLILIEALRKRASDIHIEPEEADLRVRYRIDGNLQEAFRLPKKSQNAIIARLKILSGMDITESRLPQDGRFKIKTEQKEIDFRVSILPITFGGKIVLRALDKSNLSIGLDQLGFLPESLTAFKEAIKRPFGMLLITGPTGSGKSTTLYSILNQLNTIDKNIITIEDPVEYQVEGITQIQVRPEIGLTFANGLRSLLRQSPDVIMVGEIRDSETADIAIKASLTGQLVLSTLHTNDACGAITRLVDMGCERFLIASSVILVAAQRLARKVCQGCKGKGCQKCGKSGYYGRMGILEVFLVDDKVRQMIIDEAPIEKIKEYAVTKGMKTLREDAMTKYNMGLTTMEEVVRVTAEE